MVPAAVGLWCLQGMSKVHASVPPPWGAPGLSHGVGYRLIKEVMEVMHAQPVNEGVIGGRYVMSSMMQLRRPLCECDNTL